MLHSLQSESCCKETPALCCQSVAFCNEGAVFCYRHPRHFQSLWHSHDRKSPAVTSAAIQKSSGSCSGLFGEGRVHRATKQRGAYCQFLHSFHSCLSEELAESFEADRIWSPSVRLGPFIL